ncbi:MAG: SpoIIE family protein phosphatase [Gammaproteobacteria bacterium]|nr:SpoIIE family protein phosphatase [Gammaproteobacteria bacterium]
MRAFYNLSIKHKLNAVIILTTAIILLLASCALVINDLFKFRDNMLTDLLTLSDLISISSSTGLIFEDNVTSKENIAVLKANPHITVAHIFSRKGDVFANYYRETGGKEEYSSLNEYYAAKKGAPAKSSDEIEDTYFFRDGHVDIFKQIVFDGKILGTVYIQSDLGAFYENLRRIILIVSLVFMASLIFAFFLASKAQKLVTTPIYHLLATMSDVSEKQDYSVREVKTSNDELGSLCDGFNKMLENIENRDVQLAQANEEIVELNKKLKDENLRMGAELEVTRQLQQMVLPKPEELQQITGLDIAGFMEPADEVGGDYYDVLQRGENIKIGIGDVTGHGLESGVLMLMVQTSVRTLLEYGVSDPKIFLNVLNRAVYHNVQRMNSDKNLTLSLLDYQKGGTLHLVGQHEEVLIIRNEGKVERIDTTDLGFMVGLEQDIDDLVARQEVQLDTGDVVVLYTDGITEARSPEMELYGLQRLCDVISNHSQGTSEEIQKAVIADVRLHIGNQKIYDDITLLVFKRLS